ncbi:putative N-acetyltransferase YjcF [Planctomycetes bacterium MalM25]|nr:putative N-acetyltransferase YjcF [Planctomycetes bacterium MalM25]
MHVRSITHGSDEYRLACDLRHRFLRVPLGLVLTAKDVAREEFQYHYGLFEGDPGDEGALLGSVSGKPDPDDTITVRIRQMVVDDAHRGRGCGRALLTGAERLLAERGFRRSILYAREEAAPFYERCGYVDTNENAVLIGLPHRRMRKDLA